jgi:hypothetical protein
VQEREWVREYVRRENRTEKKCLRLQEEGMKKKTKSEKQFSCES